MGYTKKSPGQRTVNQLGNRDFWDLPDGREELPKQGETETDALARKHQRLMRAKEAMDRMSEDGVEQ